MYYYLVLKHYQTTIKFKVILYSLQIFLFEYLIRLTSIQDVYSSLLVGGDRSCRSTEVPQNKQV